MKSKLVYLRDLVKHNYIGYIKVPWIYPIDVPKLWCRDFDDVKQRGIILYFKKGSVLSKNYNYIGLDKETRNFYVHGITYDQLILNKYPLLRLV